MSRCAVSCGHLQAGGCWACSAIRILTTQCHANTYRYRQRLTSTHSRISKQAGVLGADARNSCKDSPRKSQLAM
eukprot:973491-Amphidinium_carterae.2